MRVPRILGERRWKPKKKAEKQDKTKACQEEGGKKL